jgi:quinol monooxygenase YgiN
MRSIRVLLRAKPGHQHELADTLRAEATHVPATFAGCERYGVFLDPDDDLRVLLYEEWTDADSFAAYRSSEYFTQSGERLFPLLDGAPDAAYYDSELVGP